MSPDRKTLGSAAKAAVAASLMMAGGPANAQDCGNDFNADFGTSHNVTNTGGLIPEAMTGTIGIDADRVAGTIEIGENGIVVDEIRTEVESAITSSGSAVNGANLVVCDYDPNTDEAVVWDAGAQDPVGNTHVLSGFDSGSVSHVAQLHGFPTDCIDKDESTGRFFGSGSGDQVNEFFDDKAPELFFENGGSDVGSVRMDLSSGEMLLVDSDSNNAVMKVSGLSNDHPHPGASSASLGVNGSLYGYWPGQNETVLYGDGGSDPLYCETDLTSPQATDVELELTDGYTTQTSSVNASTDPDNPTAVDCNDDVAVKARFNEDVDPLSVTADSQWEATTPVDLTVTTNGDEVSAQSATTPTLPGSYDVNLDVTDQAGNPTNITAYLESECPPVAPGADVPTDGNAYEWNGGTAIADSGLEATNDGDGSLTIDPNSSPDSEIDLAGLTEPGTVDVGDVGIDIPGDQRPEDLTELGIVTGLQGARADVNDFETCVDELCVKASTSVEGATINDADGDVHTMEPGRDYFVPLEATGTENPGTGTGGTGTGGPGNHSWNCRWRRRTWR